MCYESTTNECTTKDAATAVQQAGVIISISTGSQRYSTGGDRVDGKSNRCVLFFSYAYMAIRKKKKSLPSKEGALLYYAAR